MSILDVITYPDPILRQPTQPVTTFDHRLKQLANDMFDTMRYHQGVGLAGPQIGILEKIFVIEYQDISLPLINPTLSSSSGLISDHEGCLSIPNVQVFVERSEAIHIDAQNIKGEPISFDVEGFVARIIQHEFDHLAGILIIDKGNAEYI